MTTKPTHTFRAASGAFIAALVVMLAACGGNAGSGPGAAQPGASRGQAGTSSAGNSSQGPDLSQLGQIVLGKINQDPTRSEMKVTGKLLESNVMSAEYANHCNGWQIFGPTGIYPL